MFETIKIEDKIDLSRSNKLHIGCGHDIKEGWVNHDLAQLPGVDIVHDLNSFPGHGKTIHLKKYT